jgi:hypothetical protein
MTPFGEILKHAVESTPGALGGAFADRTGEMVESFSAGYDAQEWALLTAHYGVVLAQLHAAFGTWHFGGPEFFIAEHERLGVVVHAVDAGYYALLAMSAPAPFAFALASLRVAAGQLRREMA